MPKLSVGVDDLVIAGVILACAIAAFAACFYMRYRDGKSKEAEKKLEKSRKKRISDK